MSELLMMIAPYYLTVGLIFNLLTMLNEEIRDYWVEFGFFGFIIQLIVSTVAFIFFVVPVSQELWQERKDRLLAENASIG
jgi:hypothetical protein